VPAYAEYPVAPLGSGGTRYYDDNDWLGLSLVGAARALRDPGLLPQARRTFGFVRSGWDGRPSDACPGGVYFVASRLKRYRATTSSAPAAELGAALYLATGERQALAFAERAYAWTDRCLRDAGGLYADHIDPNGTVEPTRWSYNQGSMIAAGVLLARATGRARYLLEAQRTALATLSYVRRPPGRELPYLMAIYFDDLRLLDAVRPDPRFRAVAQAYADTAWRTARDARSGLFRFAPRGFTQLLEQAAVVRLEATLAAWPVR
jgi:hypothetical protein